jgi:long-chain acyl-CoA synthetase
MLPAKIDVVLTDEGSFFTGDAGHFSEFPFLIIIDLNMDSIMPSTWKHLMPQPTQYRLGSLLLVDKAVVVGNDRKFCAALLFPTEDQVRLEAREKDLDASSSFKDLLRRPELIDSFRTLVAEANEGIDHWATVKRFALVPDELTVEEGLLTPTLKVRRAKVQDVYADEIEALYFEEDPPSEPTSRGAVIVPIDPSAEE